MADAAKASRKASGKGKKGPTTTSDDDDRTTISKKISWILRQGVPKGYVEHNDGWVKMTDLLKAEILEGITREILDKVIVDSNSEKLRYQLSPDAQLIKAYSKTERRTVTASAPTLNPKSGDAGGSMRAEASEFVPNRSAAAPAAPSAAPQMGYPWMNPLMNPLMQYPFGWPGMPVPGQQPAASAGQVGPGRFVGKLKSFNSEKGFGFIDCPQAYAQYKRDTFVHKAQVGNLQVGADVVFSIEPNKQGLPQAKDLTGLTGVPLVGGGSSAGKGKKGGKDGGKASGKGKAKSEGKAKGEGKGKGKEKAEKAVDEKGGENAAVEAMEEKREQDATDAKKEAPTA